MSLELILLLVLIAVVVLGLGGVIWWLQRHLSAQASSLQLEQIVNQVFGASATKIAEQSRQILAGEKENIKTDLDNKHKLLERLIKDLQTDLQTRQQEIRSLEKDRTQKFSELSTVLDQHRRLADELRISTSQLATVLSNNQARGEWGERIIEDLMVANGLLEGVHYLKQSKQTTGSLRPDITLLLPNKRQVPVDVKFPYASMQKMAAAETKGSREEYLKQFSVDLRTKIRKVAEYIDPSQNTLDYAIMFVPNEMIFSFINQKLPSIVDEAITHRVLIVSPFTFLIVARTVMESYRNFMIGDRLKEVIKVIDEFGKEWDMFKEKFAKYGRSIETLRSDYEEISTTRFKQMDRRITKVNTLQKGEFLIEAE